MPKSPELLSVTVQLRSGRGLNYSQLRFSYGAILGVFFSSYETMVSIGLFMDAILYIMR